ncbi:hypothetical protein D3C72_2410570 [compost metagenome]
MHDGASALNPEVLPVHGLEPADPGNQAFDEAPCFLEGLLPVGRRGEETADPLVE